jgi:hypothetical protein
MCCIVNRSDWLGPRRATGRAPISAGTAAVCPVPWMMRPAVQFVLLLAYHCHGDVCGQVFTFVPVATAANVTVRSTVEPKPSQSAGLLKCMYSRRRLRGQLPLS